MKFAKKMVSLALFAAMMSTAGNGLHADEAYVVDAGGGGYEESSRAASLAPAIALGAIAIVAIIAVAVQNTSGHSSHSHD